MSRGDEREAQGLPLSRDLHDGRYHVTVPLSGGRSQTVHIESIDDSRFKRRVVSVFSVCCPAVPAFYERALELNSLIPHGAVALEAVDGQRQFVVADTMMQATCEPEGIRQAVLSIARNADEIEMLLTDEDEN